MGHREAPGVRLVKTAVTALLLAAAVIAVLGGSGVAVGDSFGGRGAILIVVGLALTVIADWLLAPVDNSRTFAGGLAFFLAG